LTLKQYIVKCIGFLKGKLFEGYHC